MKRKKLFLLFASICLILVLAVSPFMAACAKPAVEPGAAEVAALQKEVAALEKKVTAAEKGKATSEKEIASLEGKVAAAEKEIAKLEAAAPAPAEVYEWRLSSHWSPMELEDQQWLTKHMMDVSGGRIKVENFSCDVLVPSDQNMQACGKGMIDLAIGYGGYHSDLIPIAALETGIPFGWRTRQEQSTFYYKFGFLDLLRAAYAEQNCYFIAPLMNSLYTFMSAKPFHSLEEWKGVKTRTGGITAEVLNALDIPTVYTPGSELYLAMSTGTIDAFAWCCPYTYYLMKYYEIADYLIEPSIFYTMTNPIIMSLDLWNSLPDDIKNIIEVSAIANNVDVGAYYGKGNIEAIDFMRGEGVSVITLPTEDVKKLTATSLEIAEGIASQDAKYAAPAVEAIKAFLKKLGYL